MTKLAIRLAIVMTMFVQAYAQQRALQGTVHDQQGYVIPGAHITVRGTGFDKSTTSRDDGSFHLDGAPAGRLTVSVEKQGFANYSADAPETNRHIDIVLVPAMVSQEINVTANRVGTSLGLTAESVQVVPRQQL